MGEKLNEKTHRCKMRAEGISGGDGTRVLEMQCIECYHRATISFPAHYISDDILMKLIR